MQSHHRRIKITLNMPSCKQNMWYVIFFPSFLYFKSKTAFGIWEVESCFYATLPVGSEITVSIVKCVARSVLFCKWDRGAFREHNCCLLTWIFEWNCLTWQWNIWNTEPSTFLNFVKLRLNHDEKCQRKVVYAEPNRTGLVCSRTVVFNCDQT